MNFTYVLSNNSGRRYKGHTANLLERLAAHNAGKVPSTKPHRPWALIYYESFTTRKEAIQREKYFKTAAGRRYLIARTQ